MTQSNIDKLNQYRPKLLVWQNDKTCHLSADEKVEILDIIREEFNPGYTVDLWCGTCVVSMLEYAFRELDKRIEVVTVPLCPLVHFNDMKCGTTNSKKKR